MISDKEVANMENDIAKRTEECLDRITNNLVSSGAINEGGFVKLIRTVLYLPVNIYVLIAKPSSLPQNKQHVFAVNQSSIVETYNSVRVFHVQCRDCGNESAIPIINDAEGKFKCRNCDTEYSNKMLQNITIKEIYAPVILEMPKKKRSIVVKCNKCNHDWYIKESVQDEFEAPISVTCPACQEKYENISVVDIYVSECPDLSKPVTKEQIQKMLYKNEGTKAMATTLLGGTIGRMMGVTINITDLPVYLDYQLSKARVNFKLLNIDRQAYIKRLSEKAVEVGRKEKHATRQKVMVLCSYAKNTVNDILNIELQWIQMLLSTVQKDYQVASIDDLGQSEEKAKMIEDKIDAMNRKINTVAAVGTAAYLFEKFTKK